MKSRKNGRIWQKRKSLFHQDNAPVHTSVIAMAKINALKFELLPHTPYSPDLAPSDYFLFPNLKKWLTGKRFANNEEVESVVDGYFRSSTILTINRVSKLLNIAAKSVSR
jgi:histone-lysine N-methyltransferase SETMAR